jgi:hypothetical protein
MGYKEKIHHSSLFTLLIFNVKILSNFQKEWWTFGRKKGCLKEIKIVHLKFECFKHAKTFFICVKL